MVMQIIGSGESTVYMIHIGVCVVCFANDISIKMLLC